MILVVALLRIFYCGKLLCTLGFQISRAVDNRFSVCIRNASLVNEDKCVQKE